MFVCHSESEIRDKLDKSQEYCVKTRSVTIREMLPDMIYYYALRNHRDGVCTCSPADICSDFHVHGQHPKSWLNQVLIDCMNGKYSGFWFVVSEQNINTRSKNHGDLPIYKIILPGFEHPRINSEEVY